MKDLEIYIQTYFGIPQEDLAKIARLFEPQEIAKGDFYLKHGMYCQTLSFIRSGLLRIYATYDGKEITQWICGKDYFITELSSLIFGTPSKFNIQALSNTTLYTISKENYLKLGLMVPKWNELEKLFVARCFSTLEDRIFSLLSMPAEERYKFFFAAYPELFNQVPLQYIASLLGMTPETFSRIRKKAQVSDTSKPHL
jgi:CRP-like cAMP-binding protein